MDLAHSPEVARLMKELLVLAFVSSILVVATTNGRLAAVDNDFHVSTNKPQQSPTRQESPTLEEDPILALWGPDSSYSRVPGKRSTPPTMGSWSPDSKYNRVLVAWILLGDYMNI